MSKPASASRSARGKGAAAKPGRSSVARRVQTPAAASAQVGALFQRIATIVEEARARVVRSVNSEMVLAYWQIGREIVEHVQAGDARADYGKQVLSTLSSQLSARFGRGYSATNLRYFRLFYQAYAERSLEVRPLPEIHHKACDESATRDAKHHKSGDVSATLALAAAPESSLHGFSERLSWSHYRALTKVEHVAARRFYEIEAEREHWSVPQLERQIHTQLFSRLLKSRDKAGVLELATRGQVIERPSDVLKQPYVLDFLDLPEAHVLRESDLESAILEKLQHFLLELGKGFAFVARQKRVSLDDEHFYVDLVFYHCILKCFLLIDLKLGKLTHQDVGQMDSYVRLFDEQCTSDGDAPTLGLILCAEKNEAVARYSVLHGSEQLFAAKYVTHLPSVEELQRELQREREQVERSAHALTTGSKKTRRPAAVGAQKRKRRTKAT